MRIHYKLKNKSSTTVYKRQGMSFPELHVYQIFSACAFHNDAFENLMNQLDLDLPVVTVPHLYLYLAKYATKLVKN